MGLLACPWRLLKGAANYLYTPEKTTRQRLRNDFATLFRRVLLQGLGTPLCQASLCLCRTEVLAWRVSCATLCA